MNTQSAAEQRAQLENWLNYHHGLMGRFDVMWQQRASLEQQYRAEKALRTVWKWWVVAILAVAIFIALFTVASPLLDLVYAPFNLLFDPEWGSENTAVVIPILLAIPAILAIGLAMVIVYTRNHFFLPRKNSRIEEQNEQTRLHNDAVTASIQGVDGQIADANQDFIRYGGQTLSEQYRNQYALAFMSQVVREGRAESLKEALNLYARELKDNAESHERRKAEQAQLAELQRMRKQQAVGNVVQATLQGVAIGTVRSEGAANRAAAQRNADALRGTIKQGDENIAYEVRQLRK
jgi:hypothetical protein